MMRWGRFGKVLVLEVDMSFAGMLKAARGPSLFLWPQVLAMLVGNGREKMVNTVIAQQLWQRLLS